MVAANLQRPTTDESPGGVVKATYDIPEAARRLGISRTLGFELARRDALPVKTIRLGRRMVVSRAALDKILVPEGD